MARRINDAHRNAQNDGRAAAFNGGFLDVYPNTNPQPATADTAAPDPVLVSIPLGNPAFANTANGVAVLAGDPNSTADNPSAVAVASGEAGWGRLRNAADTRREDGAVGTDFTLDNVNIVQGGTVTLLSLNLSKALS